jgi:3-methyl-2-oxobutanoate hydroxymethyltransferase
LNDTQDRSPRRKVTIRALREMKARGERIVALGVYDCPTAAMADEIGFHVLMTGPSGAMNLFARTAAAEVTHGEQIALLRAVVRGACYALISAHMPFMSYHASPEQAVTSAARLIMDSGSDVVKCDGNRHLARNIEAIVKAGVPVIGHIGLQASRRVEQSGYGVKGRTAAEAKLVIDDARACVEAGAFALLVEHVPAELMQIIARSFDVPALSLGSGPLGDGQCVVSGDAVGYLARPAPAHVRRMVDVRPMIAAALTTYREQVRARVYPPEDAAPHMDRDIIDRCAERIRIRRDRNH